MRYLREASGYVAPSSRSRQGFTIIELLVSMLVFGIIMTISLSFLQVQNRGFRIGLDHMSVIQTVRYALGILETDIQTAGTNLGAGQPEIVYADDDVITFNADYVTSRANDPFAVFYDPDVESSASISVPRTRRFTIPLTSFTYPDSTYLSGSSRSAAETLTFFFTPDTTTARSDDYALYRQVNNLAPQLVASDLLQAGSEPFFRYYKYSENAIDSILAGTLPIYHSVAMHGSPADTGVVALVDSIRAVRVTLTATNGRTGDQERTATLTRLIRLPNVGFGTLETCGSPPILGGNLSATVVSVDGAPGVSLAWAKATDEGGGENDVVRYVLYRRLATESDYEEPYLSIPAGDANYTYVDMDVEAGEQYLYALAAQDCTPTLSSLSTSVGATIPN